MNHVIQHIETPPGLTPPRLGIRVPTYCVGMAYFWKFGPTSTYPLLICHSLPPPKLIYNSLPPPTLIKMWGKIKYISSIYHQPLPTLAYHHLPLDYFLIYVIP